MREEFLYVVEEEQPVLTALSSGGHGHGGSCNACTVTFMPSLDENDA